MELQELKEMSHVKGLLWGKSARGKTRNLTQIALEISKAGGKVKYLDTESDGSNTFVRLIESGDYKEEDLKNIDYEQIETYEALLEELDNMGRYDLMIVDTLDHKHSFALKFVTDEKKKSDAEWNQYPPIYSAEKQVMEKIGKPETNIMCAIDPESGKKGKPKGAQTNVRGYFSSVVHLFKEGDSWSFKILNFVGRDELIGKKPNNVDVVEMYTKEIKKRI